MRLRLVLTILFFTVCYFVLYHLGIARPAFSLYNDDLGWLGVTASQHTHSLKELLSFTWTRHSEVGAPVLNLFLGLYFAIFGNTSAYLLALTLLAHIAGSVCFLLFLNELFPKQPTKNFAMSALYCVGFPHFHGYLWAISFQHLYFILTHFAALTLCLRTLRGENGFSRPTFIGFGIVFILASLGRTSFWFTWASVIWLLLTSPEERRATALRKFAPLLALTLLYPFLESYDGTWGSQVERLARSFWWSYGLLKAYRAIPVGWLICWILFVPIFVHLLPKLAHRLPGEKSVRRILVTGFALLLIIHAFYYKEDLFYIVISYVKYLYPSLHESSPAVLLRWQPVVIAVADNREWITLFLCALLAPLLLWWTLCRLGIRAAILFLPIIPSLFYSRTMGGGGFLPADSAVHYFVISRYLLYFAPWTIVSLSSLIPRKRVYESALVLPFALLLLWHMKTFHDRLEKTALSEASAHFSSLFPESLRFTLRKNPARASVSTEGIEAKTFDDPFSVNWNLAAQLPMDLFLWHLNRENPEKFRYATTDYDYQFCDTTWCDHQGRHLPSEAPLVEVLSLKPGQSAKEYLSNVGAASWEEWIHTCWKLRKFNYRTKKLLLDDLKARREPSS